MKENWSTSSGAYQSNLDSNKNFHVFVGNLGPEIDQQTLRDAFAQHGEISDVKIMKDPHTNVPKGYGFISFVNKMDAEPAIAAMNGQLLGTRQIRTNWATRKFQPGSQEKLDYNEVWNRSSDTNTRVYCGGLTNISEDLVRNIFSMYGQINDIHPFPDRGYAFVRFATKEAACNAICGVNGMEINGSVAICSWGKENMDTRGGRGGGAHHSASSLGMGSSLYGNANNLSLATTAPLAAMQNAGSLHNQLGAGANNAWNSAGNTQNTNWAAAANYQWPGGYPQNTMNFLQGYPGYQQNTMMQGRGMMSTDTRSGNTGINAQYQLGQYQQGANGKS